MRRLTDFKTNRAIPRRERLRVRTASVQAIVLWPAFFNRPARIAQRFEGRYDFVVLIYRGHYLKGITKCEDCAS
jgi:hypothetical protein